MRLNGGTAGVAGGGEGDWEVVMQISLIRKYDDHRIKVRWSSYNIPMARTLHHPPVATLELTGVLHALSDPVRLQIVRALAAGGELRCGAFALPVSKSTTTHHFRVLRESGVIEQCADGTAVENRLRRADLDARFPGLLDSVLHAG
jgi:DNA-binding transcriptional ArsR family regulator